MDHEEGAGGGELRGEVAVADGVDGVRERGGEAESLRGDRRIGAHRGPGHGAGAEGAHVRPLDRVLEAAGVALQPVVVAEEDVAEHDRLRVLEMRDAGEDRLRVVLGPGGEGLPELVDRMDDLRAHGPGPEPQVERDLIVAAPRGMELCAERGDELDQLLLDVHVDVLVGDVQRELSGGPVQLDLLEAGDDPDGLLVAEDALLVQHLRVGDGALDVLDHDVGVGVDGRDELRGELVRRPRETFPDDLCHLSCFQFTMPTAFPYSPRRSALFIERRRPFTRMNPSASFEL